MKKIKESKDYIITIKRLYDQEKKGCITYNTNRFYDVHIDKGYGYGVGFAVPIKNNLASALKKVFKTIQEELHL